MFHRIHAAAVPAVTALAAALILAAPASAAERTASIARVSISNKGGSIAAGSLGTRVSLVPRPVPPAVPTVTLPAAATDGTPTTTFRVKSALECDSNGCRDAAGEAGDGTVFTRYPLYFVAGDGIRLPRGGGGHGTASD